MANRLLISEAKIREKIKTLDAEGIRSLEKSSNLSLEEVVFYQELKSIAQVKGLITAEEGSTIYKALLQWDEVKLPLRVSLTLGLGELAKLRKKGVL